MLGNTNDGFSGFTGIDAFSLTEPMTIDVRGYDAGSENNNEKTGLLGSLGAGNDRDPKIASSPTTPVFGAMQMRPRIGTGTSMPLSPT